MIISYSPRLTVVGSVFHVTAMLCTIFRLVYRGWTHHLWWEDAWAAFAMILDVICVLCLWKYTLTSLPSWTFSVAFTSIVWAARMSMIFSIIRITNHSGRRYQGWITYLITVSFACMWAAVLVQKNVTCVFACHVTEIAALLQMSTDIVADVSLIAAPLQFWKNARLSRNSKILIFSTFGASLLITAITIPHSIMLFYSASETTLIIAHVKAALSLVICNLLVIVTFVYRTCWKESIDPDETFGSPLVFASIPTQFSTKFPMTSTFVREETAD
ncbi:hypothetical protein BDR04DRAFT_673316 [Suillus decipiens]|nr:hypothetical protein BDR04DRAFT_673316 [Suillus decipiens]